MIELYEMYKERIKVRMELSRLKNFSLDDHLNSIDPPWIPYNNSIDPPEIPYNMYDFKSTVRDFRKNEYMTHDDWMKTVIERIRGLQPATNSMEQMYISLIGEGIHIYLAAYHPEELTEEGSLSKVCLREFDAFKEKSKIYIQDTESTINGAKESVDRVTALLSDTYRGIVK